MHSGRVGWPGLAGINSREGRTGVHEALTAATLAAILAILAAVFSMSMFTQDSWAYYELSTTILQGDFYRFNTQRSYFSVVYSAAFPMGYPMLLAGARVLAGDTPLVAVVVNIALAALSWVVVHRIALALGLSRLACLSLAFALLLWPWYLQEVLAGRAIPAALFFFALGVWGHLKDRPLAAGLALGLAAITRFDYLVFGIVFLAGSLVLDTARRTRLPLTVIGFAVGLSPWVAYSLVHFGRLWVTDSSWVALSASPAFNLDYPAAAGATAMSDFPRWLARVAGNVLPTARAAAVAAVLMPVFLASAALFALRWKSVTPRLRIRTAWLVLLVLSSTAPYVLTGYADYRYYPLALLAAATGLLLALETARPTFATQRTYLLSLTAAVALSVGVAAAMLGFWGWRQASQPSAAANMQQIRFLERCHARTPQAVYIFPKSLDAMGAQYGAMTGRRTALTPSNFDRMPQAEKEHYFEAMRPYVRVEDSLQRRECEVPR